MTERGLAVFASSRSPEDIAADESYWEPIQRAFNVDRSIINFNNGKLSPTPVNIADALRRYLELTSLNPKHMEWAALAPKRKLACQALAKTFGCHADEMITTRNASESLGNCIFGIDLKPGDEILMNNQEYFKSLVIAQQRERREGIVVRQFSIPTPFDDPQVIVRLYENQITPRTKMIILSHMSHNNGQIMPVREIVQMARTRGIDVVIDGAHSFAHLAFKHADLDCDYFCSSLHKWLHAPCGTGMLYVRREKIRKVWPMFGAAACIDDNILKFEEIGTHPTASLTAIGDAIAFYNYIGPKNKEARLRYLRDRWAKRFVGHDRIRLYTNLNPARSCGIALVGIDACNMNKVVEFLEQRYQIHLIAINHPEFAGLRVSPSVYTTLEEVDRFSEAMEAACRNDGLR